MRITSPKGKWCKRGCVASVILYHALWIIVGSVSTAPAAVIPCSTPTFGLNSALCDTSTGLEWLNLRFSQGQSANQVLAQLGPGGTFAGFRYADRNEFVTLFTEIFGTSLLVHLNNDLDLNATIDFANLFGPTGSELIDGHRVPTIAGLFDVLPNALGFATFISIFYSGETAGIGGGSDTDSVSPNFHDIGAGSFLVSAVPEPLLSLFSVSLMGLAAVTLRRKRNAA